MELTIVVPAYNEARRLAATVRTICAWLARRHPDSELVVVDDGSTDDTSAVLAALADEPSLRVIACARNRGKGAAVRDGVLSARGARVAFVDADLAYGLDQLELLLSRLADGAELAVGARDLVDGALHARYSPARRLATVGFNALVGATLGLPPGDTQCGLKAFDGATARALFSHVVTERFGFDVELLFLARRWGLRVERVGVRMLAHADSSVRLVGDSANMLADLLRIRARDLAGAYPARRPPR